MFYYEERNVFGKWTARTMPEKPTGNSASGTKREIRNVQEVPPHMEQLTLGALQRHFNPEIAMPAARPSEWPTPTPTFATHSDRVAQMITDLANEIHADNVRAGWWTDLKTGEDLHGKRNVGELLCLIHSEVSEAMEGHRKRLMDDKLPHRPMLRAELIDAMIRIFDLLGSQDNAEHPAGVIFQEKREYNAQRADHKPAARLASGGKAF